MIINKVIKGFLGLYLVLLPVVCSASPTSTQFVERARTHIDQGELNAATIELKNALQQNPEDAQARIMLGEVQLLVGNAASAEKELRRASKLDAADGAVLPLLARALLAQGKLEELQALSLENLAAKNLKAEALAAQGLGKLAQVEVDAAVELIDQAASLDPKSLYVGVAQARLLAARKEYDLARNNLDGILKQDLDYAPAWSLLGDLESIDRNLAQAETAYTKSIENSEYDLADLMKRAMVRIQQKKYVEAQEDINVLKKRGPDNPGVNYMQGLIHFFNNRLPEAREAFELTLQANYRHQQAKYYLSQTHLRLGNQQQAQHYARQFLLAAPDSIHGRKLMASIELGNGQYTVAEELIRPVVDSREDDVEALNLLAKVLLKQDKTDEAIKLLEKAAILQPDSAIAQFRLGTGLIGGGKYANGVEHIKKALEIDPELEQAYVLLVQYYLEQKDFDKALAAAEAYRDRYPGSATPYNLIGRAQLAAGQVKGAVKAFTHAREMDPGNKIASHSLAALAARKKANEEARGYYQDVLEHHENDLSTLLKLAVLDGVENKKELMLEHLQQAVTAHPKSVKAKVLLARYYLAQGKPAKVPALMNELSEEQRQNLDIVMVMAQSQLAQKQYNGAKVGLEQLIEQKPNYAQAHFLLAQTYAGLGDRADLKRELERTIELAPGHFAARLALARLLLLEGDKEKATEQLAVLDELSPENTDVLRLKASLARAQGDQKTASALLKDVFEMSPSTDSMLAVARQKWAMGEQAAALKLQEQWTEEHPDDLIAALALAGAYSQQDQVEPAIAQFQKVLKKDEQNVVALNGLAWHLRNKQPVRALEFAEHAAKIAPESSQVLDTLALVQLNNGQVKRAKRSIERAYEKTPNDPAVRYHYAMIDAAAGDKAAAIKKLQVLLNEDINFTEKADAQQLLAELQAGG